MNYSFLSNTALFHGIREDELQEMLPCLNAHEREYQKNEIILRVGDTVSEIGLIESGSINIVVNFYWGNSHIFGHIGTGDVFAQNFAAIPGRELNCDVVAAEDTEVLFIDIRHLLSTCQSGCPHHRRLIHNLIRISAEKNLSLSNRMMHTAPKSIRDRLLSYFSEQATLNRSPRFSVPFSRQQLADYLGVDRSALSNELSKMRRDGLIAYQKNDFQLNNNTTDD